ncbi:Hypothetical predicted protein [Paramuricea clavata]|uniref:Uncharacterized protein n=1 Tax=Paramuricea clavata TaxID=317549 RepID=A0A6S7GZZ2_PARCT|nr:Hypothetical predicted protein [Paramuricea clavata]
MMRTNLRNGDCTVYYCRKYQFSACQDGAITTRKYFGKGGEFYEVKNMDAFNATNEGFGCQQLRYLTTVDKNNPHLHYQAEKRIIPSFMFVSDVQFINESVHFELHFGADIHKGDLGGEEGRYIVLEFSIFEND